MNKRFWMAFAACYVVGMVLGFLVHGVWLDPTYKSMPSVWRPEAEQQALFWVMIVSGLIATFAFCLIFTKGYEGKGVMEGVRYGVLIGLLAGIPTALDQFWIYPIPFSLALKWLVTYPLYWIALGAVLAAIYRPTAK